ncbi:alpha/beta fold hydrolase [Aestuariivirga sp.]|uniref:alpha/beta fold hydrolase n=1 Tax=Aestuariivirga sp. TaxID=2650926 RepID=UPI0030199AD1
MSDIAFKTLGGEGPDLVMIHGFGSDRLSWAGTSPALMEVARVHALDLPGHGESLGSESGDGSPLALAELVADVLDANGIGQAHLLGHSLGGGIAMVLALAQPERVLSLSLIAPTGLGRGIDRDFLADLAELATREEAEALLQRLVTKPLLINRFTIARVLEQLERPGAREALRKIAEGVVAQEEQLGEWASQIAATGIPRLVIFGGADQINPPDAMSLVGFAGRTLVIPEAGHLPHVEAARQVNAELTDFIKSVGA